MRKGFTLVELSIVLVVIGLLIGSILVAQSMASAANIVRFIRDLQQYDIAFVNYQTKYSHIPGDSNLNSVGNNDGNITCNKTSGACQWDNEEISYYWEDLSNSGYFLAADNVAYTHIFSANNFPIGGHNAPKSAIGNNLGILVSNPSAGYNGYSIGKANPTAGTDNPALLPDTSFTWNYVMSVDTKLDNANPMNGNIYLTRWAALNVVLGQCRVNNYCGLQIMIGTSAPANY